METQPKFLKIVLSRIKKEAVLAISLVLALGSMFFIPPSPEYFQYIDLRVLILLFCLMAVVAGFQDCGLFLVLAQKLLSGRKNFRFLCLVLVLLPFFCSMFITNDVALITFVPFAVLTLGMTARTSHLIYVIVLQTIAANLGSMVTPVGNPQNLFLYARFQISPGNFFQCMLPLALASLAGLVLAILFIKNDTIEVCFHDRQVIQSRRKLMLFFILFLLCLLSVFYILPYQILFVLVVAALFIFSRSLLARIDYSLLLTFVCFFIFAGNMGNIGQIRQFLSLLLEKSAWGTAVLASQVVSNVPAAVLLSGFTQDWKGLLVGTNLGGLGTLIASLASLISFKLYLRSKSALPLRYLGIFTLLNLCFLLFLNAFYFLSQPA